MRCTLMAVSVALLLAGCARWESSMVRDAYAVPMTTFGGF
jgi:hypothetical protein